MGKIKDLLECCLVEKHNILCNNDFMVTIIDTLESIKKEYNVDFFYEVHEYGVTEVYVVTNKYVWKLISDRLDLNKLESKDNYYM